MENKQQKMGEKVVNTVQKASVAISGRIENMRGTEPEKAAYYTQNLQQIHAKLNDELLGSEVIGILDTIIDMQSDLLL